MKMASILTLAVCLFLPLTASANDESLKIKVGSTARAVQLVKHQYQGKVLRVQASNAQGNPGYKVKMISKEGRVFYLFVDAQNGNISGK
ncbi:hypothetical protein Ping_0283 [Psychromonas ingrahamii 37]|uniref:PepSY domain-containing protein n=1 Tax=Psychromonas ingrahamii (strain DSM 17664 / CCUG 51855 / 37) TaxID=357804 RepID=A1SRN4_PSYIN|nr:PepSY domain-containing protein [Psychromonas ingrahamii]ABM02149.1 hypothetical protein Ping_0283 [Psychromonas ingrahamii 37]